MISVIIDINSSQDHAHWFGIDSYKLLIDINSSQDHAHWFGIDRLRGCDLVDINSWSLLKHKS